MSLEAFEALVFSLIGVFIVSVIDIIRLEYKVRKLENSIHTLTGWIQSMQDIMMDEINRNAKAIVRNYHATITTAITNGTPLPKDTED